MKPVRPGLVVVFVLVALVLGFFVGHAGQPIAAPVKTSSPLAEAPAYRPNQDGGFRPVQPTSYPQALDQISYTRAGHEIAARSFLAPTGLGCNLAITPSACSAIYGTVAIAAPQPAYAQLSTYFASAATFEAAFPNCTTRGDCNSSTYSTNSLDWAVWTEAVAYTEARAPQRAIYVDAGAYTIAGTITSHLGTLWWGEWGVGSGPYAGTGVRHYGTGDMFFFDGAGQTTGAFDGTGGGVVGFSIWKANSFGVSYGGGACIHLQAQKTVRPGEFIVDNVLCDGQNNAFVSGAITWDKPLARAPNTYSAGQIITPGNGYTYQYVADAGTCTTGSTQPAWNTGSGSTTTDNTCTWTQIGTQPMWSYLWWIDGVQWPETGGNGVRNVHFTDKVRGGCYYNAGLFVDASNHVHADWLQVDGGDSVSGTPSIWLTGNSVGAIIHGEFDGGPIWIAQDGFNAPDFEITPTQGALISSMTGNGVNPTVMGFDAGTGQLCQLSAASTACGVWVTSAGGNTALNGGTNHCQIGTGACNWSASILSDAGTSLSVAQAGNGTYTGGGVLTSAGPQHFEITGVNTPSAIVWAPDAIGKLTITGNFNAGANAYTTETFLSNAPRVLIDGPNKPAIQFTDYSDSSQTNVTGDSTVYTVQWNSRAYDQNADETSFSAPYAGFTNHVAGRYHVNARVALSGYPTDAGAVPLNGYVCLSINNASCTHSVNMVSGPSSTGLLQGYIDDYVYLEYNISLRLQVSVGNLGSKALSILDDSGNAGFTMMTLELMN